MKKILVIEDDDQVRLVIEVALKRSGYDISTTENGHEGIRKAREWLPDLILCDINMPQMDGRDVLRAMRNDAALANRQFVLMTGDQKRDKQREGMNLGADDYLPKPFEIEQLITCVEARLRRSETYQRLEEGMLKRHANMFRGTLPHEIITPLNGILGFAEILKEDLGKVPREEALHMLSNIEESARRLHRTLMNFLTLMNIENTALDPRQAPPHPLAAESVSQIVIQVSRSIADAAGRTRDLAVSAESIGLAIDESALKMIVQHLVENACGYSQPGSPVAVEFKRENNHPILKVTDRGRGMTREQIDQIGVFTQFERKRYEQQGLGIGLTLVRRLVERAGGQLKFESTPGQGTTAIVEFR